MKLKEALNIVIYIVCSLPLVTSIINIDFLAEGDKVGQQMGLVLFSIPALIYSVRMFIIHLREKRLPLIKIWDLFFFCWILWMLIRGDGMGTLLQDERFYWFSGACLLYFSFRVLLSRKEYVNIAMLVIAVAIMWQSISAALQIFTNRSENIQGFITGGFYNPALLGGFISVSIPLLIASMSGDHIQKETWLTKGRIVFIGISIFASLMILPHTMSRAAWLAAGLGMWIVFSKHPGTRNFLKPLIPKSFLAYLIIFGTGLILFVGLYTLKKDSADGRLLVWKLSAKAWNESFITGNGFNSTKVCLPEAQLAYFKAGTYSEEEAMLAGNVHSCFNEGLQISSELGLIGAFLFFAWLFFLLFLSKAKPKHRTMVFGAKGAISAMFVFSMFSYPFISPPLFLLLVFCAALISAFSKPTYQIKVPTYLQSLLVIAICGMSLAITVFYVSTFKNKIQGYSLWHIANAYYQQSRYEKANNVFEKAYPTLLTNGRFLVSYAKSLELDEDYLKALEVLNEAGKYWKDEYFYVSCGNVYKGLGKNKMAEKSYLDAAMMIPHKFYPHFLLFKLYDETESFPEALEKAEYIRRKRIKINNKALQQILIEMEKDVQNIKAKKGE